MPPYFEDFRRLPTFAVWCLPWEILFEYFGLLKVTKYGYIHVLRVVKNFITLGTNMLLKEMHIHFAVAAQSKATLIDYCLRCINKKAFLCLFCIGDCSQAINENRSTQVASMQPLLSGKWQQK